MTANIAAAYPIYSGTPGAGWWIIDCRLSSINTAVGTLTWKATVAGITRGGASEVRSKDAGETTADEQFLLYCAAAEAVVVTVLSSNAGDTAVTASSSIQMQGANVAQWLGTSPLALSSQQVQAVVPITQKVDVETIKTRAVTCGAGVTVGAFVGNATAALAVSAAGRIDVGLWLGTAARTPPVAGMPLVTPLPTMNAPLGVDLTGAIAPYNILIGHYDPVGEYAVGSGYPYFKLRGGAWYIYWNGSVWKIAPTAGESATILCATLAGNYVDGATPVGTVAITVVPGTTAITAKTDLLTFEGSRVLARSFPSHGGIGNDAFQFKLTTAAAEAKIINSGGNSVVDTAILDATQRVTTHTPATIGTQWQVSINVLQHDHGWTEEGSGDPWIEFSSSDESVATVNSEGFVTYVGNGTCNIIGISQATAFSPSQRFALSITNTSSGGETSDVTTWIADAFDASKHLLVVYNADVANSVSLKDYYLSNRPGVSTANVLGLTGLTDGTSTTSGNVTTLILDPLYAWLVANEAMKPIRYIVFMRGVPSRAGSNGSVGYMAYDLLNARGYRVSSNGYKGGESRFTRGEYQGATGLPVWIDMGSYVASIAYIDKLAAAVAGLQADGVTLDGSVAGVAGDQWLFDEKRSLADPPYSDQYADDAAQVVSEGIAAGDVTYQDSNLGPAVSSLADPAWYGSWGYYAWGENLPDDVTFSGLAGWWVGQMVQSYGGIYDGYGGTNDYMPDPTEIFAATAFGGTAYSNTPVGYVGFTDEPYLSGIQTQHYPGRWARGWTFAEAAWVGRNTHYFLVVGDPLVTR